MAGKPMTTPPLPDQPEGTVDAAMALHAGHLEATIAADGSDRVSDKPAGALENISIEIADIELLASEVQGERIGRYKLLQQIGEGGFGTVWMAEQMEPVTRRVALKIIKLGMDTREVIARFEAERQALAMMDHPNIAKVLDAGATDKGRPFFVMELVKGIPITQYCDETGLGTRERLALFGEVCAAIQHAHQKGIIHRDIKPSNVMVTLHGDKPVAKVIDFGIAKATQGKLTDKTLFTRYEQFIGTPVYMSPEQASLSGLDIDTRSDIYALGILLYELLVGKPPFDAKSLLSAGYEEMRRIIREVDPVKPSSRISTMAGEERTLLAKARHIESAKVGKLIEPDLDWIVMKAIEKDRTRRYETASAFAQDIERHLQNEPVLARPPSFGYKAGKFIRKHKSSVAALGAVLMTLIAGLAASAVLYFREQEQHRLAEDRLAEVSVVQVLLGKHLRETDPEGAFLWFSNAAESGNPMAMEEQGLMLSNGVGVPVDISKAVALFQAAANRGSVPASAYLGECYLRGIGVPPDPLRGIALLRQAADAGYPQAIARLGDCYAKGTGTTQDFSEAARLFEKASDLGNPEALGNLAVLYINGQGVPKDLEKAFELINRGASKGQAYCMSLLAQCVEGGVGTPADLLRARSLYHNAAEAGDTRAKAWCKRNGIPYNER